MNAQVPATAETTEQAREVQTVAPLPRRAPLVAGNSVQAIVPRDVEQAFRLASAIAAADMAPKSYKRDANAIMVGIMHGMEVGFTPMAALQSIAVINGMPSIWGDGALGLIQASGLLEDMKEWIDTDKDGGLVAHCRMKRRNRAEWIEQAFSWKDAQTAKLTGKDTYQLYGRRMLQRRARAWAMTDGFADVLRGLHIREAEQGGELEEQQDGSYRAPQRPVRGAVPIHVETVDSGQAEASARALDRQFAETMRDEPAKENGPAAGLSTDPVQSPAAQPQEQDKAAAPAMDYPGTAKVIIAKLHKAGTAQILESLITSFADDIEMMRTDPAAAAQYEEVNQWIKARRAALKR